MEPASLVLFAMALFLAAGSPGPSIAALVARVVARGHRDVFPFLAAMWIGEAIWLSAAVWGMAALAQAFQPLFAAIKWLGVVYLLYLAWKMWTAPAATEGEGIPARTAPLRMFAAGLSVTLGNPKIMLFYIALLPTLVDLHAVTVAGWASLVATMAVVLVTIDLIWVLCASQARRFLKSARAVRAANRCGAGLMAGAAAAIAAR